MVGHGPGLVGLRQVRDGDPPAHAGSIGGPVSERALAGQDPFRGCGGALLGEPGLDEEREERSE
jgi:hypothetical protein